MNNNVAVIILAAGMGTRMKSDKAKVLHEITDQPMISYVVETAKEVADKSVIVVVGHQAQEVHRQNEEEKRQQQEQQYSDTAQQPEPV